MLKYVISRLLVTLPMVLVVISLTWALIRLAPGNFYSAEKKLPAAIEKNINSRYGRDKPVYVQYFKVLGNVLTGDFGTSLKYQGQSVNQILWRALPVSAALGLAAYTLALLLGVTAGTIAALKQNSRWDYLAMGLAMFGISVPNFVLGPLLVLLFAITLGWLPPARWDGIFSLSAVLPVLTLAAIYTAYISRLTRSGMLEVLRSDYIRTARAKGLSERLVIYRHALGNSLLPVVTVIGLSLGGLLGGAVLTESIFGLTGVGKTLSDAITARDYTVVQGFTLVIAVIFVLVNLIVDISYGFLDPRIRLE